MNASLDEHAGRPVLRLERHLAHPPVRVWQALTHTADLAAWFPAEVLGDWRPGARLRFRFPDEAEPSSDGRVVAADPPRLLVYDWGGHELRWEIEPAGTGCRLLLTHQLDDRRTAPRDAAGWHLCLDALAAHVDGSAATSGATWDKHFAAYVEAFDEPDPIGPPT